LKKNLQVGDDFWVEVDYNGQLQSDRAKTELMLFNASHRRITDENAFVALWYGLISAITPVIHQCLGLSMRMKLRKTIAPNGGHSVKPISTTITS
jgi:hypothetical protein